MMRIAYVSADPGVPVFGRKGCSIHVQEMVRAFYKVDAALDLFAARTSGDAPFDLKRTPVISLPCSKNRDPAAREQESMAANGKVFQLLQRHGPYDLVYERYSLWNTAGMEYAREAGIPGILEVNAPLIEEQASHRKLANPRDAESAARRVFGAATALLAVSDAVASYLENFAEARGRIHVVPNGVDTSRFSPDVPPACPKTPATFTVGFLGTLKPWHDLPTLIDAFADLYRRDSSYRLLIVGDGPERASIEAALAAHGAEVSDAAQFTGTVGPDAVPGLLNSMDVAVAPYAMSSNCYFSPLKVFEYMAMGLPVVASRIGQLATLIEHEGDGLLFPPGDSMALADGIDRLRRAPEFRSPLGRAGRVKVLARHTWDRVAARVLALAGLERHAVADRTRNVS